MSKNKDFFYIYLGGGLFTHKDLLGNAVLAESIYKISGGKYRCALPQNFENRKFSPHKIRDEDILQLLNCDLALFNYDGTELDSGTVIEFMFAKFADIPSLLLRTDFRGGGDCKGESFEMPWNLMTSFYPRTEILLVNSADLYKTALRNHILADDTQYTSSSSFSKAVANMIDEVSEKVVAKLDELLLMKSTMKPELQKDVFEWISQMAGFESPDAGARVMAALERKSQRKLL